MEDFSQITLFVFLGSCAMFSMVIIIIILSLRYQKKVIRQRADLESRHRLQVFTAAIEAEERQKNTIARNLHDTINPNLGLIKSVLYLHNKARLEGSLAPDAVADCEHLIQECIDGIKDACYDLVPQALVNLGLAKSIEHLADRIARSTSINCKYAVISGADLMSPEIITKQLNTFRVVQEVLNNIVKHASPTRIDIQLKIGQSRLFLLISYDGNGLDSSQLPLLRTKGLGLNSIESRLLVMNGDINYKALHNNNKVEIKIPFNQPSPSE